MTRVRTTITFLGTAAVVPAAGHDTASFLINGQHLVDAGWYAGIKMLNYGFDPIDLETVFISHCHPDHYMGLPHILFYLGMRRAQGLLDRPPLKVVGPAADIQKVVDLARKFLQIDQFPFAEYIPLLFPLTPGESLELEDSHIDTCGTHHPVEGLCYRFTDEQTQVTFVATGDTAYHPPIADLARGVPLLIHEAAHGPGSAEPGLWGHSSSPDAARIAQLAGAKRLALMHCPEPLAQQAVAAAQQIFPNTFLPEDGQTVEIPV